MGSIKGMGTGPAGSKVFGPCLSPNGLSVDLMPNEIEYLMTFLKEKIEKGESIEDAKKSVRIYTLLENVLDWYKKIANNEKEKITKEEEHILTERFKQI